MNGTEKQIKWANDIIAKWAEQAKSIEIPVEISSGDWMDDENTEVTADQKNAVEALIAQVLEINDAETCIDNKDATLVGLLKRVVEISSKFRVTERDHRTQKFFNADEVKTASAVIEQM